VISKTHEDFWICFDALPVAVQKQARERFQLWRGDAFNASLQFKELFNDVWSVRVNQNYRALGRRQGNLIVWFWIGTHAEYDHASKAFGIKREPARN
jgi:hypothetical protein